MSNFITPNELLPIMDEVIILDARGFQDYKRGHIKGAFPVDIDKDLTGPIGEHGGRHPLPDMEQLAKTFETFGINENMILGFFWLVAFGGPCATWALKMYAFYLAVLKDG